jgi:hypothetical protein
MLTGDLLEGLLLAVSSSMLLAFIHLAVNYFSDRLKVRPVTNWFSFGSVAPQSAM